MASIQPLPFGTLLKRSRRAARLTQEELAARAGYSAAYISLLERNVRLPTTATISALADALALTPTERASLDAVFVRFPAHPPARVLSASRTSNRPPLVGRAHEMLLLDHHLGGKGPSLLLLAGEPGIGKTRLLHEAIPRAEEAGWAVLESGCHRRSGQEPYAPLLGALAGHLRRQSPPQQRVALEGCTWLVRLLPELSEQAVVPVPRWTLPPEQERRLMFAAVGRYLANVAGPAGTLLVLDDLQWAGADALDLLASLLRALTTAPLRLLGAYRSTEVRPPDPLVVLAADLSSADLASEHQMRPLTAPEARQLLTGVLADEEGASNTLQEQVLVRAGGVPYFLISCAEALRAGTLEVVGSSVPWNVRQSIRQRVAMLPEAAQDLLGAAAVVGRESPVALLLAVAAQPHKVVIKNLEALDRARLLVEGQEACYQFPHDLIREVVLSDLSAIRRASFHQQVAETLEQVPEGQQEGRAAELAWHWQEAGDAERALPYALLAGEQAEAVYAHQDAERHYQMARNLAHKLGDQRREAEALEQLGRAVHFLGRVHQALALLEQVLALYQVIGDVEGQGRVLARLGHLYFYAGKPEAGVARVQALVAPLCTDGLSLGGQVALFITLTRLYINSAEYRGTSAQYGDALSAAEQAEALALQAQDERLLGQARVWRGVALQHLEHEEEGTQVLQDAIRLLEARGDLEALSVALHYTSVFYHSRGEYGLALASAERSLAIAERLGDLEVFARFMHRRGELFFELGQWEQARQDCEQVVTLLPEDQPSWPLLGSHLVLGLLSLAQGQAQAAAAYFQRGLILAERSEHPGFLYLTACAVAYQDLVEGRPQAARTRLEPFLDRSLLPAGEPARVRHLLGWASVELGDLKRAEALLAEASKLATAPIARWVVLDVLRSQARLALRQGRGLEAEQMLAEAIALCQAMHTPYDKAQTLYLYGLLHMQRGEAEPARERLEAALTTCEWLGERLYTRQIEQALATVEQREPS